MDIRALKKKLRERVHVNLRAQAESLIPTAAGSIRDLFLKEFQTLPAHLVVAGTSPIKHELDPTPLLQALEKKGHALCLPVVMAPNTSLTFRAYKSGDKLIPHQWNILVPEKKEEKTPDIILCPMLAFDRAGRRLGYGGGYYDITLKTLRAQKKIIAIGLAYAAQEVEEVPTAHFDQKMDAIITEKEVIRLTGQL
jgi:5-formyltetrahydrofolate cyclo-ligase